MTRSTPPIAGEACGSLRGYRKGCRCEPCRAAKAASTAKYAEANRARARQWYEENPEVGKERARKWGQENRSKYLNHRRTGYAKRTKGIRQRGIDYEALWTGSCGICSEPMERSLPRGTRLSPTIDHIIPLSKGGDHVPENLQWAHMACNAGKSNRV